MPFYVEYQGQEWLVVGVLQPTPDLSFPTFVTLTREEYNLKQTNISLSGAGVGGVQMSQALLLIVLKSPENSPGRIELQPFSNCIFKRMQEACIMCGTPR